MCKNTEKSIPYGVTAIFGEGSVQKGMLHVLSLQESIQQLKKLGKDTQIMSESVSVSESLNRILAEDIVCREDLPGFVRSLVDGFAVVGADTFGASAAQPALLLRKGEVKMGQRAALSIAPGECAAVWTGGELPQDADAMVMLEETEQLAGGWVAVETAASPGSHVVFCGDDCRAGEIVLSAGRRITARETGLLCALGVSRVSVYRDVRVHILSTGDELVGADQPLKDAQMRDVNGPMLRSACAELGTEAAFLGIVADDETALRNAMLKACEDCDLLLLSGASSAGAKDAAAKCLASLGNVAFHGIAIKPGKPTFAGTIANTIVVGLPGHPAAAFLVFCALVRPLISALSGGNVATRTQKAVLTQTLPSNHGREELVPVRLSREGAEPVPLKSGLITPLSRADGYIRIPRDTEGLHKGTKVEVILF